MSFPQAKHTGLPNHAMPANHKQGHLVKSLKATTAAPLICQRCKKRFVGVPLRDICQCQRIRPKRGEK